MPALLDRIASKFDITDDGCWEWNGGHFVTGYGAIWFNGGVAYAHRVVYEAVVGPISEGLVIDHLCRNRACVNPDHLEPVTPGENILRGEGYSAVNARKTHCSQGHEFTPENTRMRYRPSCTERVCIACADIREAKRVRR